VIQTFGGSTSGHRALAAGIALLFVAALWLGVAAPACDWFRERSVRLERRGALLGQMQAVARELPRLREAARGAADPGADAGFLPGAGDAVAAAVLQQQLQAIAASDGVTLMTVETVPPTAGASWHRVGLRLGFSAPWPQVAGFLQHVQTAPARVFVDDLHVTDGTAQGAVLQVSMLAYGLRFVPAAPGR
jgi:hypothetical protein